LDLTRRLSPRLHYWIVSAYHPIKAWRFARKHPKIVCSGPRIVLVAGEDGPDKPSMYIPVYSVYEVLRPHFNVELSVHARFSEKHARRIVSSKPDLVVLSFDSGEWQEVFESYRVHLFGSSSEVSRLCYDKAAAKALVRSLGIATPDHVVCSRATMSDAGRCSERLGQAVVVKPRHGGSSQGVCRVEAGLGMKSAIRRALRWDDEVLIEAFAPGKEYTCTVYGNNNPKVLPLNRKIMAFELAKMEAHGEQVHLKRFPVVSNEPFASEIKERSIEIYRALGCRDMARIDWKYDHTAERLVFLEINCLPWIGRTGGNIELCAEAEGSSYEQFILQLFRDALARFRERSTQMQ